VWQRGEHDIENEMIFKSNMGFVFHDSRGFEAGSRSELDKVIKVHLNTSCIGIAFQSMMKPDQLQGQS
jgi:hypothetical protein